MADSSSKLLFWLVLLAVLAGAGWYFRDLWMPQPEAPAQVEPIVEPAVAVEETAPRHPIERPVSVAGDRTSIPLPPLDGYAIVPLVLNDRMRDKWFRIFSGGGALMGLIIAWVLFDRLMPPVFRTAIGLLYTGI